MTNEETIRALEHIRSAIRNYIPPTKPWKAIEAIDLAISALERDRWISVVEKPEPRTKAIVYSEKTKDFMVGVYTEWGWMFPCYFGKPSHYKPLPEPPKEET